MKSFEDIIEDEMMALPRNYRVVRRIILRSWNAAFHPENRNKNRRADIPFWEQSRVWLANGNFDRSLTSSYINANWVHGYKKKNKFIATQAPMKNTVDDFLTMVWLNSCRYIFVLTKFFENGVEKCFPYWPTRKYGIKITQQWLIHFKSRQCEPGYKKYVLIFCKSDVPEIQRTIILYHYARWPQNRKPSNCNEFWKFFFRTRFEMTDFYRLNKRDAAPIVVHGSDGINRTVQFCIYSNIMEKMIDTDRSITTKETIKEMEYVHKMRYSRIVIEN
uniref:AsIV-cont00025-ORF1 n=1 Tax=Apophua simplicipes ichnovirus TaxID=1329648 RepID=S5DMH9_9VIRU|nr:AsIV-cont00025-ORF1 [Apophua simplicipes ichnovirus]